MKGERELILALLSESTLADERAKRLRTNRVETLWDEAAHQIRLIEWAAGVVHQVPALEGLAHIPNGGKRVQVVNRSGQRWSPEAYQLYLMGTRTGYPDLLLDVPVPARGVHGLKLELKTLTGELRPEQRQWLLWLRQQG